MRFLKCLIMTTMVLGLSLGLSFSYAENFNESMRLLEKSFFKLFTQLQDKSTFSSEYHEKEILKNVKDFQNSIKHLNAKKVKNKVGDDPIVQFYIFGLKEDLFRAEKAFLSGHKEYARTVLKSSVNYCFKCHTRSNQGPKFNFSEFEKANPKVHPVTRADLLLASRQFDKAESVLFKYIMDTLKSTEKMDPFSFERAIEKFVTLVIKSGSEKKKIKTLADIVSKSPKPNKYLIDKVKVWSDSINKMTDINHKKISISQLLGLFEKANIDTEANGESSAQMQYLYLSSIASKVLQRKITNLEKANLYYWMGKAYSAVSDFGYWEAPDVYYQSCIVVQPKSSVAQKCYQAYESSVTLGFTGSRGTSIPHLEQEQLNKLKKKAFQ